MNIEELQAVWQEMSSELEKQKKLTHQIIMQMTQERYRSKLQKIANIEGTGAIVCFLAGTYVVFNFNTLDTWYLQFCGIFTIAFLFLLPVLVMRSIFAMRKIDIRAGKHAETLARFTKARNQFLFLQRIGIGLALVLMFTTLPVASKIMTGKDLFTELNIWLWYLPVMLIFIVLFSRWGYGHYKRITNSAGHILSEMEE